VTKALFTHFTVVKVFLYAALVTDAYDWVHTTTITYDACVNDFAFIIEFLWSFNGTTKVLTLEEFIEDLDGLLLKLIIDEVLEGLAWDVTLIGFLPTFLDTFDRCLFCLFSHWDVTCVQIVVVVHFVSRLLEVDNEGDLRWNFGIKSLCHTEFEVIFIITFDECFLIFFVHN